ncbi:MAG: hypothetical protein ACLQMH_15885 [Solirubrobacteraceae bacterium]
MGFRRSIAASLLAFTVMTVRVVALTRAAPPTMQAPVASCERSPLQDRPLLSS